MRRINTLLSLLLFCSVPVLTLGAVPAAAQDDDDDLFADDEEEDDAEDDESEDDESESEDDETESEDDDAESAEDDGEREDIYDEEDDEDDDEDGEDTDDEDGDSTPAASDSDGSPAEAQSDADLQTIYVIQSKPRLVQGSFEFAPQIALSVNDRFTSHSGLILSGLYHLKENIALELSLGGFFWWDAPFSAGDTGPRLGGRDTEMTVEIRQKERLAPELVQLYRLTWLATMDMQWSPIYGKVSVHDVQLGQFNVYLSVGAGFTGLQLENQQALGTYYQLAGPLGQELGPMSLTTTIGGGLRFYFGRYFGVRFEVRDYVNALSVLQSEVSSEPFSTFDVTNTVLAQLGVSFIF